MNQFAVWGRWHHLPEGPLSEDYLWHFESTLVFLAGDCLSILGDNFQIEAIEPKTVEYDSPKLVQVLYVRPYQGTNEPKLMLGEGDPEGSDESNV